MGSLSKSILTEDTLVLSWSIATNSMITNEVPVAVGNNQQGYFKTVRSGYWVSQLKSLEVGWVRTDDFTVFSKGVAIEGTIKTVIEIGVPVLVTS